MALLRSSPYVTIEYSEEARVVRFVRSALPFGDAKTAREELDAWHPALEGLDPAEDAVLLDFRQTPMTSDPDILREVVSHVDAIALYFTRRAILMARPLLATQSERVLRAGAAIAPFTDEADAWAHVTKR